MSLLFNMCLRSVPCLHVGLSKRLLLNPFCFLMCIFLFSAFYFGAQISQSNKTKLKKNKPNKFPQLTSRCASSRSWPLFLGWSIRAQSAVFLEIKAQASHSEGRVIYLCFYDTPCSNFCVCTQHKRSVRQHTQLAQPYLLTSRLIPSVCFFNAPPFTFSFIVRFVACAAAASVSPSASTSTSACYPCPSCSACCCCPAGSPFARCRLVYCVIVGKWRPNLG